MLMEAKTKQKTASSAINDGVIINDHGIEVVTNTESLDHWNFLDEIEAPMWADLSVCDLTNDIDDPWFNISHQFHQCSSSQLISTIFHPTKSIIIQEPPSPKLPTSVSKSRGKNYKIKDWEQRKCKAIPNKQHSVKTLTKKSYISTGSINKMKPIAKTGKLKENEGPKAFSSCESYTNGLTDNSRAKFSKSSSSYLAKQEKEHQSSSSSNLTSFQTSSQTSGLLSSLKINLRKSCATRPAARVVANGGRCSEGSSSKSSVGPPMEHFSFGKKYILGDAENKAKVSNLIDTPALNVGSLSNKEGNTMLASKAITKGKVEQKTSDGKMLMPHNINKQNQIIDKETVGQRTASLASIKEMATCQKAKCSDKLAQSNGNMQRAFKENVTQKNGSKKLIGIKEKANDRSRDKDTAIAARKVYFR